MLTTPPIKYSTILPRAAARAGYQALSHDCYPKEYWILERMIRNMKQGGIDYELVATEERPELVSLWRKTNSSV